MTIEEILSMSAAQLTALTKEQLEEFVSQWKHVTDPSVAEAPVKVSKKHIAEQDEMFMKKSNKRQMAENILKELLKQRKQNEQQNNPNA
jgi:hypothetical protein